MHSTNRYAQIRQESARVGERPLFALPKITNELELQARWFAGEFGRKFQTLSGEPVEIVQFGFWNHEAGPDFKDAAIRIAGGAVVQGAIEIDLLDRNWELHGHAINPAFDDAILHIFLERSGVEFFARTSAHRNVPQVQLDLSAVGDPASALVPLAYAGRCVAPLKNLAAERINVILEGAARFRLQQKANRLRQRIEAHGRDEALFQALADALGYKQNRLPFSLLTQRLPLRFLRQHWENSEALLFGVAGFIDALEADAIGKSTRSYLRSLWDRWWKYREQFSRLIVPAKLWKASGTRPTNHPHRRLGALATLVTEWKTVSALASHGNATAAWQSFLTSLGHDFWNCHYTLAAKPAKTSTALIGDSRAAEILANVIYPLAVNDGHDIWDDYKALRAQLSNQAARIAAARLFARDPRQREFLRTVAGQQGLLQIYEDFCLRDTSDCVSCPLPEQLRRW
jgi:Protein of unknown function (DUF2851)